MTPCVEGVHLILKDYVPVTFSPTALCLCLDVPNHLVNNQIMCSGVHVIPKGHSQWIAFPLSTPNLSRPLNNSCHHVSTSWPPELSQRKWTVSMIYLLPLNLLVCHLIELGEGSREALRTLFALDKHSYLHMYYPFWFFIQFCPVFVCSVSSIILFYMVDPSDSLYSFTDHTYASFDLEGEWEVCQSILATLHMYHISNVCSRVMYSSSHTFRPPMKFMVSSMEEQFVFLWKGPLEQSLMTRNLFPVQHVGMEPQVAST